MYKIIADIFQLMLLIPNARSQEFWRIFALQHLPLKVLTGVFLNHCNRLYTIS